MSRDIARVIFESVWKYFQLGHLEQLLILIGVGLACSYVLKSCISEAIYLLGSIKNGTKPFEWSTLNDDPKICYHGEGYHKSNKCLLTLALLEKLLSSLSCEAGTDLSSSSRHTEQDLMHQRISTAVITKEAIFLIPGVRIPMAYGIVFTKDSVLV